MGRRNDDHPIRIHGRTNCNLAEHCGHHSPGPAPAYLSKDTDEQLAAAATLAEVDIGAPLKGFRRAERVHARRIYPGAQNSAAPPVAPGTPPNWSKFDMTSLYANTADVKSAHYQIRLDAQSELLAAIARGEDATTIDDLAFDLDFATCWPRSRSQSTDPTIETLKIRRI
jgi:hypothetical protein